MNKKTMIIIGVVALGVIVYIIWKKKQQQAPGVPSTGGVPAPASTPAVTTSTNPVTGQSTNSYTAAGGYPVPLAITDWAKTIAPNNQAQFFKCLPLMTSGEIDALYDIIINQWGKGASATPAQRNFWDTWRVKYHILDGTYNNFNNRSRRKPGQKLVK